MANHLKTKKHFILPYLSHPDSYTKLFLGPGFPSPQPQIVDLTGESQSDCPEVAPYPLEGNSYNGVGTFVNGRGMVCGG